MRNFRRINVIVFLILSSTIATQIITINAHKSQEGIDYLKYDLLPKGTQGIDWSLKDVLSNNIVTFRSFEGKVVLLDFWAIYCGPCKDSMIELQEVKNEYSSSKVVIISMNTNAAETESEIEDFANSENMDWIVVQDTEDIADFYQIQSIPTFYVFDKELKVFDSFIGVIGSSTLINTIDEIFDESSSPSTNNPGEPISEFWAKNWYWFVILGIFILIGIGIFIQRQRVIQHNKKIQAQKSEKKKRSRKKHIR